MWAGPFAATLAVLLARNAFLFSTPLYETADQGADSILVEQARRFSLLVGIYSRDKFNHPGPAFLYVEAWGESVFWAVLHVVPTPWNGQMIAVYMLNALWAALAVAVGYRWIRSPRAALVAFGLVALFGALHSPVFSSDWFPYLYVLPFFVFVLAIASVGAGAVRDLPIAALSGWFLIHGHACFLLFVPALTGCAMVALAWPRRGRLRAALRSFVTGQRRAWVPAVVISALFLLPMLLEAALHWPGNFGKYFGYGSSSAAGGHSTRQVIDYTLWFWWPRANAWAAPLVLCAVAVLVTWRLPAGPVKRLCVSLLAFDAAATVVFVGYVVAGVDQINEHYIGYFYWSVPITVAGVIVLGVLEKLPPPLALTAAALAAAAALSAFAVAPFTRITTFYLQPGALANGVDTDSGLPAAVARLAADADGRPLVLHVGSGTWVDMTGILVQSQRSGVTACVTDPAWAYMVTSQFICTPEELAKGAQFWIYSTNLAPRGTPPVVRLARTVVTARAN